MSDKRGRSGADEVLRRGLRAYVQDAADAAEAGADEFNARVLAALAQPMPWWRCAIEGLRPMLAGAACAALLVVVLASAPLPAPGGARGLQAVSSTEADLEGVLGSRVLTRGSLARRWAPGAAPDRPAPKADQRSMRPSPQAGPVVAAQPWPPRAFGIASPQKARRDEA